MARRVAGWKKCVASGNFMNNTQPRSAKNSPHTPPGHSTTPVRDDVKAADSRRDTERACRYGPGPATRPLFETTRGSRNSIKRRSDGTHAAVPVDRWCLPPHPALALLDCEKAGPYNGRRDSYRKRSRDVKCKSRRKGPADTRVASHTVRSLSVLVA